MDLGIIAIIGVELEAERIAQWSGAGDITVKFHLGARGSGWPLKSVQVAPAGQ